MTKGERKSLKELSEIDDVVITKADKGGAIVNIDVKNYNREAQFQLKNNDKYGRLKYVPTGTQNSSVNGTIKRLKSKR